LVARQPIVARRLLGHDVGWPNGATRFAGVVDLGMRFSAQVRLDDERPRKRPTHEQRSREARSLHD
jgi:hypothetical protein